MVGIGSLLLMCSYAGLVIFAFYDVQGCDPINAKLVEKADQLFPLFVMQVMGDVTCIPGLFVAGKEHCFLCFRTLCKSVQVIFQSMQDIICMIDVYLQVIQK